MTSLASRFFMGVWRGPISRNLSGAVGTQVCLLMSGTLAARLLGPENRGYLAILTAWPSAIGQIGAVGMSLAATYFLASNLIGGVELVSLLRRPALIQLVALTTIDVCVILGYTVVSGAPILLPACISFLALPAGLCLDYGFAFLLGARRHGLVNAFRSLSPGIFAAGLVVLFVLNVRSLVVTVICLVVSVTVAGALIMITALRAIREMHPQESIVAKLGLRRARQAVLAFGRRGYIGYLSPVDTFRLDQLVVGFLVSPEGLGFYVVGAAFTNFARLVAYNVGLSSTPEIASHATPAERWIAVRRTLILSAGVLLIVNVVLAGAVPVLLPLLFGDEYTASIPIAEILLVAGSVLSMKRIAVDAARGAGEAQIGTQAEIVNLVLFMILCAPSALLLGGSGVALALLVASIGGSLVLLNSLHRFGVVSRSSAAVREAAPARDEM